MRQGMWPRTAGRLEVAGSALGQGVPLTRRPRATGLTVQGVWGRAPAPEAQRTGLTRVLGSRDVRVTAAA